MPNDVVYIGRGSIFGNPFDWRLTSKEIAVAEFRSWLGKYGNTWYPGLAEKRDIILRNIYELRGRNICCWCSENEPCHGDVLLEIANE